MQIPRWDLSKFHGVSREIGSSMKSVGEVMAIGRNFEEAIQKGLRMIGQGAHGFVANKEIVVPDIDKALREPTDNRIFVISKAFQKGYTVDEICDLTKIDKWFLEKLYNIVVLSKELEKANKPEEVDLELLKLAKQLGFSDFQIGRLVFKDRLDTEEQVIRIRKYRKSLGIVPYVKQIDTLAGEFPAQSNYLYLTYNGQEHDVEYKNDRRSIIVLGSGAYRIGSSVEFDWCSVNALQTIRKLGWRGVMINYNPETVSTDYDICDRLYFDELTFEGYWIYTNWNHHGIILSVGGQIQIWPYVLTRMASTSWEPPQQALIEAEGRHKFSSMLDSIKVDQPKWQELTTLDDIHIFVESVGFPVLMCAPLCAFQVRQ